jgi:hypothetical protein
MKRLGRNKKLQERPFLALAGAAKDGKDDETKYLEKRRD